MKGELFTDIKVGIFVIIGLFLGMVVLFQVGSQRQFFAGQYTLYANFRDISGLRTGAPVQLAGLNVGYVDDIKFSSDILKPELTVVLRIVSRYKERIRSDSVATVNTQGLLGDKFIYVSVGSEGQPIIPDKGVVPAKETTSIFSLAEKAGSIMDDIGEASKAVNSMLKSVGAEKEGDLKASVKSMRRSLQEIESGIIVNLKYAASDLREILGSVRKGEGTVGMLIRDPSLYNDLRALLGHANRNMFLKAVLRATVRANDEQLKETHSP